MQVLNLTVFRALNEILFFFELWFKLEFLSHQYDRCLRDARLRMTTTTTWKQQQQQQQLSSSTQNRPTDDVTGSVTSVDVVIQQFAMFTKQLFLRPGRGAEYCDERVCVCLFSHACLSNPPSSLYPIVCECCLGLSLSLVAL